MIPKFRGLSIDEKSKGEWQYGYLIEDDGQAFIINEVIEANEQYITIGSWCPIDKNTVSQSTCLHDKNGKEIFEGDIVKRYGIKRPEVVRFGEWIDVDTLGFKEQYIGFYFESEHEGQKRLYSVESRFNNLCKVIGNIYEKPELLEVVE